MEKQPLPWNKILKSERLAHAWTQANVAERVRSDPKTVSRWESGKVFPDLYNRQKLSEIFGKSVEELGLVEEDIETRDRHEWHAISPTISPKEDWGEIPHLESFYGRETEIAEVEQWIIKQRCRMVGILGIGGVGKTAFATIVAKKVKEDFEYIFWRSLRNAPPLEAILTGCLQLIAEQQPVSLPQDLDGQLSLLITALRMHRCLLILDNIEPLLQAGQQAGIYQEQYESYGRFFQRIGEADHQSCLLFTSREKPQEVALMEGKNTAPVQLISLTGVNEIDGQMLLKDKAIVGSTQTWATFVKLYSGIPLALKLVSEPIRELFNGDIAAFLNENKTVFGGVHELLDQQFQRLSALEQEIMYWLAIEREAVSLWEIREDILHAESRVFLEAFDSLRRRSLVEVSGTGQFTLQTVIMEYITERLVEQIYQELEIERPKLFGTYALIKAQAKDYIRESQVRFILEPVARRLVKIFGKTESNEKLQRILSGLHTAQSQNPGYAAGNLLNLFTHLKVDLRNANFSHLTVAQAYLQNVELPEVNFSHSDLSTSVFNDTFSSILCLASSSNGNMLAAGTTTGEVRLWLIEGAIPLFTYIGHTGDVRSVAFSPNGKMLASCGEDQSIRIWDTSTGECLKILQGHTGMVRSIVFSANGDIIASGSEDKTVRLWDVNTGSCINTLQGHTDWVRSVTFDLEAKSLASSSDDLTIRIWESDTGECLRILQGHTHHVRSVAFNSDGEILASAGEDQTIRLWDSSTGDCIKILQGHTALIRGVIFTSNDRILASCSDDQTIRLWNTSTGDCIKVLQGHTSRIWSIISVPKGDMLISVSEDDTMRFWWIPTGQCLRTLRGHSNLIKSVAFSPDGNFLASGSEDQMVRLWDIASGQCRQTLKGHMHRVRSVAFSPDGAIIASGSEDETVRLWDVKTGQCLVTLRGHTHLVRSVTFNHSGSILASGSHDRTVRLWDVETGRCLTIIQGHSQLVWSVAFSPDDKLLASSSEDETIRLWGIDTGQCLAILRGHTHRVFSLAFSPDGKSLVSSSDDQTIRIWSIETGECLKILQGHTNFVRCVVISPNGHTIASGSHDQTVRLWDVETGHCLNTLQGHSGWVWSIAFSPNGTTVASGSDDGTVKIWLVPTGECIKTLASERFYEDMNITGTVGLTKAQRDSLKMLGAIDS